jgi:hypothetical protein
MQSMLNMEFGELEFVARCGPEVMVVEDENRASR